MNYVAIKGQCSCIEEFLYIEKSDLQQLDMLAIFMLTNSICR